MIYGVQLIDSDLSFVEGESQPGIQNRRECWDCTNSGKPWCLFINNTNKFAVKSLKTHSMLILST